MNSTPHLESRLRQIYDHLYANATIKTPSGIAREVGKILRTISFLEKNKKNILDHFSKFNIEDEELTQQIALEIKAAYRRMNQHLKIYSKEENIRLKDFDIAYVCAKLDGIMIDNNTKDVFGDAMEVFRSSWTKQNGGQFFTDQRVTNLAIKLLKFNPTEGDDLIDICAGTGGFLLAGLNRIKNLVNGEDKDNKIKKIAINTLKGQEIDEELYSVANATLSFRTGLNSNEAIVQQGDSILPNAFSPSESRIRMNSHSCIATNPPFGTKITIKDPNVLKSYELARSRNGVKMNLFGESFKISNRSPDILFIEQNIRLLKPGYGRLAIVVPYQIVSGPQTLFVREWILKNAQLLAVIDLPPETFQPHTGTKASLVVMKRRYEPQEEIDLSNDPLIFMATPRWIGHDRRGNPTYQRSKDGSLTDEILSDFPDIEKAFDKFDINENPSLIHSDSFAINPKNILLQPDLRIDARSHISKEKDAHKNIKKSEDQKWKYLKLNDVVKKIFYPGRFPRHYVEHSKNSVPFLGGTNISQLILKTEKRISLDHPKIDELQVDRGWILITRSGSTGIVSIVPKAWEGFAISEHVIRIIPDTEKLPPEYLYAFLRTKYAQDIIARGVYGSVIDEITPEYIGNIEVPVPKSTSFLNEIVEIIKRGENARQQAVESLMQGVDQIEKKLFY